ncbi:MAG: hypothetical protein GF388_00640 [Candidatus Aegiribacteria sp.]|nr:hypothetical protein [Candidatus Aegiribacteria sp.]MBD3293938.1 hypothetical protein [Candidatus Fermentibacteria bacterium]
MKYFLLLLSARMVMAGVDGGGPSVTPLDPPSGGTDAVNLYLLQDWTLTEKALGLDVVKEGGIYYVVGADDNYSIIQGYHPDTGGMTGSLALNPSNTGCFGVAWNGTVSDFCYLTNDWYTNDLYYTEDFGSTWSTTYNPAGNLGRGMDFDGLDYWQTDRDGAKVWRFFPGVGEEDIPVPQAPGQLSGLTVFPFGANLGVIVASYSETSLFFFEWDGVAMYYLGSASLPVSGIDNSLGIAYYEVDGSIFWSYMDTGGDYHLTRLEFEITDLQHSTWGSIKSTF